MSQELIAITGGPSGGKTTLIEAIRRDLGKQVAIVPEAASLLFRGGFPRIPNSNGTCHSQRAIYLVQSELESLICSEEKNKVIVCDRGSLDGAAYWPAAEASFYKTLKTTRSKELKRYSWVIHLDTAGDEFYDDTNPIRTESFSEAFALNERIKSIWEGHPRRFVISANKDFFTKMSLALSVVQDIIDKKSYRSISKKYFKK